MSILRPYIKKNKSALKEHKIYLSISSEGLGHSSRALAIIKEFDRSEVLVGSYSYALDRFAQSGYNSVELPQELKLVGEKGAFDVGKTIMKNHSWALTFNQLVNQEIEIIRQSKATCVVADGRLVPVMAADKLSLPCIVITNQSAFYPFFKTDSALIRVFGKSFDWIMKTWLSSAEEIIIPDFPPPYTICKYNLSGNFKVKKRTRFTGPLVGWDRDDIQAAEVPDDKRPYIVVTLGGHLYRKPILDNVVEAARTMPHLNFHVFTKFEAENPPENVTISSLVPDIAQYLKAADIVITQAGHSSAMELMTLGKKAIIIPDLKQIEQENNARRMAELELALVISYEELSAKKLGETIDLMLNESKYDENTEKFAQMAAEIQGRKKAAELLREYSSRMLH